MRAHLERKDRKKAINEVRYSTNGKMLAVAGDDAQILVYDVLSDYEWIGTCVGHKGPVTSIDWSTDSKLLQSDDTLGHHLYWDVESCKEVLVAAEIRDSEWVTWTCIMGWPVQGIAPKFQGPLGINATCRSSFGDALASVDDWGMLKLFRFPCITPGARCKRYGGHSARVGKVRFSFEEKTVLSTGNIDGLIIQWRYLSSGQCGTRRRTQTWNKNL
jgi:WD40 repeat protein